MRFLLLLSVGCLNLLYGVDEWIGPCCPLRGACANVFSLESQTLFPGDAAIMEGVNVQSKEIDLKFTPLLGEICFNQSGSYKITWNAEARSSSHIPSSWTLALSLDHEVINGSSHGDSIGSNAKQKVGGTIILDISAGQILRLINASSNSIELVAENGDSDLPATSVCMNFLVLTP